MFSKGITALGACAVSLVVWFVGSAGCTTPSNLLAGLTSVPAHQPMATPEPLPPRQPLPSERVTQPAEKPYATDSRHHPSSVAEFLDRTSAYQYQGSPAVYASKLPPMDSPPRGSSRDPQWRAAGASTAMMPPDQADRELRDAVLVDADRVFAATIRREPVLAVPVVKAVTVAMRAQPTPAFVVESAMRARPHTANQPLSVRVTEPVWSVDSVLEQLERDSSESGDLDGVWPLKFAQLAFHRDSQAAEIPATLPAQAQSILGALMRLVPEIRSVVRDSATPGDEALTRVDELRRILMDRSDPVVSTIALCRKVVTYGVYDELDASGLVAGRENQAIVYSEIRNLRAEKTATGSFRSLLATRLEVLTDDGKSVWLHEEPGIVDESRTRRIDFFLAERITLPSTLPAGAYVLKVMVQDKLSERMHEVSKPFDIVSAEAGSRLSASLSLP